MFKVGDEVLILTSAFSDHIGKSATVVEIRERSINSAGYTVEVQLHHKIGKGTNGMHPDRLKKLTKLDKTLK